MASKKARASFKERINWYPVTTIGWIVTFVYTGLLVYVIVETHKELYSVNEALFRASMLISGMVVLILLWARFTVEKPFCAKK